ncbi:hypothetical protein D3C72_1771430 [compost metagenome]
MQRLQLQPTVLQLLLYPRNGVQAKPRHRHRAIGRLRTMAQRYLLQIIQQHRFHFALQGRLQASPGQRRQLQLQQDQVLRVQARMHHRLRKALAQR